jgi:hypothetical protein
MGWAEVGSRRRIERYLHAWVNVEELDRLLDAKIARLPRPEKVDHVIVLGDLLHTD